MSDDSMEPNPLMCEDPLRPGEECLIAMCGQGRLTMLTGVREDFGFLAISPRHPAPLTKELITGNEAVDSFQKCCISGLGILLLFATADDALFLAQMIRQVEENMRSAQRGADAEV